MGRTAGTVANACVHWGACGHTKAGSSSKRHHRQQCSGRVLRCTPADGERWIRHVRPDVRVVMARRGVEGRPAPRRTGTVLSQPATNPPIPRTSAATSSASMMRCGRMMSSGRRLSRRAGAERRLAWAAAAAGSGGGGSCAPASQRAGPQPHPTPGHHTSPLHPPTHARSDIQKLSKQAIFSLHRGAAAEAAQRIEGAKKARGWGGGDARVCVWEGRGHRPMPRACLSLMRDGGYV